MSIENRIALGSIVLVVILSAACLSSRTAAQAPELPGGPVRISEESAKRLEDKVTQAFQQSPSGQFTLRATDEEITSWVALRLANQPESHIADPQIRFTQGKAFAAVTVTGILPFRLRTILVASMAVIDERIQLKVEKSSAGPFPVPGPVLDFLSQTINETLMETQLGLQITQVEVLESEIVVAGLLRQ
jgi:hypothetical protein